VGARGTRLIDEGTDRGMNATRSRFRPDHQLTARMALTLFLLGLVYVR